MHQPFHLTYCLNVHPGDGWEDQLEGIRTTATPIKKILAPDAPFGLGLRLSHAATSTLNTPEIVRETATFLTQNGFYAFTVNAFPYGTFHRTSVKEHVYRPDWRTRERLEYTCRVADILAGLIQDGNTGSISTVPGAYKSCITSSTEIDAIVRNLMEVVRYLAQIESETGKTIHLGLEPEPDCLFETTQEAVHFFSEKVMTRGIDYLRRREGCSLSRAEDMIHRYLGVCFDTCHLALQYEDLIDSLKLLHRSGILISKIQISAALKTEFNPDSFRELLPFCDPVYLHQVKIKMPDGQVIRVRDLSDALADYRLDWIGREWRIHFHVPLYTEETTGIRSTSDELTPQFFKSAIDQEVRHFEIETYTFDLLPHQWRKCNLIQSIVSEYHWVIDRLASLLF